jgi:hypothetical protein
METPGTSLRAPHEPGWNRDQGAERGVVRGRVWRGGLCLSKGVCPWTLPASLPAPHEPGWALTPVFVGWLRRQREDLGGGTAARMVLHARSGSARQRVGRCVQSLVAAGAEVDERDANGRTALHWAANKRRVEAMQMLVQLGADKEAKDSDGDTPLHVAACHGHVEAMKVLVQLG